MRKFEVGDKVRVVRTEDDYYVSLVGMTGTITNVDETSEMPYDIDTTPGVLWCDEELEAYVPTPRIDPTIITRLNEVVTMLTKAKRTASRRRSYCVGLVNRFADYHEGHRGYAQERLDAATAEHDNIVARIEAVTKVIEELTKA